MRSRQDSIPARRAVRGWPVGLAVLALTAATATAQPPSLEPRVVVGKCVSPQGTLLQREQADSTWASLGPKDEIHSRDLLLALPGVRATLDLSEGVRLGLWGSLPELTRFPVLESAVILHDSRAYDLDITLDRGRVVLANRKKKGAVRIWVRLPGTAWDLTLPAAGDEVALELTGGKQPGVTFDKDARRGQGPLMVLALHVLKGSLTLKIGDREYALDAPPGPAYFHWDSAAGPGGGPHVRKSNPEWADAAAEKKLPAALRKEIAGLPQFGGGESVAEALAQRLRSADKLPQAEADARRRLAIYALGAVDNLQGLTDALAEAPGAVTRQAAVETLRHWIGRGPGRDRRLYRFLVQRQKYAEAQAETVLQLLHSPFDADRAETYETLIAYLRHSRLAVRELARWHLYRLAPAGRKIPYDAGAAEAERIKGYEAWKKLIPSGKLPPAEAPK